MKKTIKLTETELTRLIEKVISEQELPRGIRKGSEEHADWIRSQQGDGSDEILEALLSIAQRLERFVKQARRDGDTMEDLRDIQKDVMYQITQYIGTTEGRG
jgi:uncharacterized protein YllA (UPF0747 family)